MRLCSMRAGHEQEWGAERGVSAGPWNSIAEDSGGRLWIRSSDRVLVRESTSTAFHAVRDLPVLNSSRSSLLVSNSRGQVLIPHNAGLMICDGEQCRNCGPESGLPRTEVLTALEDREGSLWFGYSGRGLARQLGGNQWQSFTEEEGLEQPRNLANRPRRRRRPLDWYQPWPIPWLLHRWPLEVSAIRCGGGTDGLWTGRGPGWLVVDRNVPAWGEWSGSVQSANPRKGGLPCFPALHGILDHATKPR